MRAAPNKKHSAKATGHNGTQPSWSRKLGNKEATDGTQWDTTAVEPKAGEQGSHRPDTTAVEPIPGEQPPIRKDRARTPKSKLCSGKNKKNERLAKLRPWFLFDSWLFHRCSLLFLDFPCKVMQKSRPWVKFTHFLSYCGTV